MQVTDTVVFVLAVYSSQDDGQICLNTSPLIHVHTFSNALAVPRNLEQTQQIYMQPYIIGPAANSNRSYITHLNLLLP